MAQSPKPAASEAGKKSSYKATTNVLHSKKLYRKDHKIELTESEAAPLLLIGSIKPAKEE
jgi:hypothetical protein